MYHNVMTLLEGAHYYWLIINYL